MSVLRSIDSPVKLAPGKRATIIDVARECGVSKSTVSAVLSGSTGSQRVAAETRKRIRQIAEKLSYKPSWRGQVLAGRGTQVVGVLYTPPMPLIARGNYEGILSGINEVLHSRGYHLLLMPLGENPIEWRRILAEGRIDGAIVLSRLVPQLAEILESVRLPVALVNAETTHEFSSVLADDYGGAREMTEYLVSLGHQRIAFLLGDQPAHYSVGQRQLGYEDAMNAAGLHDSIKVYNSGSAVEFGTMFASQSKEARPTACVCYTHYLAIKLLQVLWQHKISVPAELSVCCFSNSYPVADVIPPLTTVALATEQMGRTVAEMLLTQLDSPQATPARKVALKTKLIIRESTAAPGQSS